MTYGSKNYCDGGMLFLIYFPRIFTYTLSCEEGYGSPHIYYAVKKGSSENISMQRNEKFFPLCSSIMMVLLSCSMHTIKTKGNCYQSQESITHPTDKSITVQ